MESLRDRTKRLEGWKLKPYPCSKGHMTIGAGWNLDANPLPASMKAHYNEHKSITEEMAEELLTISIEAATNQCRSMWPEFDTYTEHRQWALIDVIFNMGAWKILHVFPSFVAAVRRQDWRRAADELKYSNGLKKDKLSDYWTQLHGDPDGTDDKRLERPEENYKMLVEG